MAMAHTGIWNADGKQHQPYTSACWYPTGEGRRAWWSGARDQSLKETAGGGLREMWLGMVF